TVHLATCVLLLEAARADNDFSDDERRHILSVLQDRFALSPDEAKELLTEAMNVHDESTSLHQFTRTINSAFPVAEKVQIVEEIWRIFYADQYLDGHEDHLAAKLRNLLNLSHPVMIEAKMRVLAEIRSGA
ncbi:MAG: TerB family tellurite resistance protein, partial [Devosia sp.]